MADSSQHPLFECPKARPLTPREPILLPHWGQEKKKQVYGPDAFNAAGDVPVQGINYPTIPAPALNPFEAQAALNYLHQQWLYWLQCRAAWYEYYTGGDTTL
ncbi:unnamed protein product [Penicillium palitans]